MKNILSKSIIPLLIAGIVLGTSPKSVLGQESPSVLFVPLIGITSVPEPLALPNGPANVTYKYAVKNFIKEVPLSDIQVIDDTCSPVKFIEGDDNNNSRLDFDETWRFTCRTQLTETTQSITTATGHSNNITTKHRAYATVVVGDKNPAPLVSIINITKVAYPLSLPSEGGNITFTYKVNNPGEVALSNVIVSDDKCSAISSRVGDTNSNNLLDISEVWIYTCNTTLTQTTTNTVRVSAFGNGLKAVDDASITVKVDAPVALSQSTPNFPEAGTNSNLKVSGWKILLGITVILIILYALKKNFRTGKVYRKTKSGRSSKK
jgi:hypothetical protein